VYEHKTSALPGFTWEHNVNRLVWFEAHGDARSMVIRERQIKEWRREWKIRLIESVNPMWHDLYGDLLGGPSLRSV
jgi:putative endonuclease